MLHLTENDLSRFAPPEGLPPSLLQQAHLETQKLLRRPLDLQAREQVQGLVIDPEGCLERDDAIWIEEFPDGTWKVDVSIADVAEHIRPGMALDHIANLKGFSRYEEDEENTTPTEYMFPDELSENYLSLLVGVPRLTMTVSMVISSQMEVQALDIRPTYIVSPRDFSYEEAAEARNDPTSGYYKTLLLADRFVSKLHGFEDVKPRRGGDGVGARRMHTIVGEFMILANCAMADYALKHDIPVIYRNFDEKAVAQEITFGYYSTTPGEHKAIGKLYMHGTSPMRRLPDLQNWRMIKQFREEKLISRHQAERSDRLARRVNVAAQYAKQQLAG